MLYWLPELAKFHHSLVARLAHRPLGFGSQGVGKSVQAASCLPPASLQALLAAQLVVVQNGFLLDAAVVGKPVAAVGALANQIA